MHKYYLETSAVNYFLSILKGPDLVATRNLQLSKGRIWFISTTVLWELMLNKDQKDYDTCQFLATFLFHEKLLKSSAEIFLDYVNAGCPSYQVLKNPFTESFIGKCWEKGCKDRSYSYNIYNSPLLEMTETLKDYSKYIGYLLNPNNNSKNIKDEIIELKGIINHYHNKIYNNNECKSDIYTQRATILILLLQICCGMDITGDIINAYWDKEEISNIFMRIEYFINKYPSVFHVGPLWNMANPIALQCHMNNKRNRGTFHDGLHSVYLPFIDKFITHDKHFLILKILAKKELRELYKKIYHLDELKITTHKRKIQRPHFF